MPIRTKGDEELGTNTRAQRHMNYMNTVYDIPTSVPDRVHTRPLFDIWKCIWYISTRYGTVEHVLLAPLLLNPDIRTERIDLGR